MVQADAPRHGAYRAVSWPAGSQGAADLAGSNSQSGSQGDRSAGYCGTEGKDSGIRAFDFATGHDGLGFGFNLSRQRQARRGQRGAHSPGAAEGLGSEPAGRTGEGFEDAGGDSEGFQWRAIRWQKG